MTLGTYLTYVAAVVLLILTPGPTMLMCMTHALHDGPGKAMTSVAGSVGAVLFFAAFFPQFFDPAAPFVPQFAVLALTFVTLEFTVLTCCALGVSRVAPILRSSRAVRWFNRLSGGLFTLMGSLLLLTRRHT